VDDESTGGKSFVEVMVLIERAEDSSNVRLLLRTPIANADVEEDIEKGEEETKEEEKEKITAIDDRNPAPTTTPPPPPTTETGPDPRRQLSRPPLPPLLLRILPPDRSWYRPRRRRIHPRWSGGFVQGGALEDGGVSAVPFDLRCDDDDGDGDSGGGDRDWRTMVSQMLLCLTDAGDGVVSQSSMDRPLVIGLLSSRSMVGSGKNDVTDS